MIPPPVTQEILKQLAPLLILFVGGLLFLAWSALRKGVNSIQRFFIVVLYLIVIAYVVRLWSFQGWPILGGMLVFDRFALFFIGIIAVCALGTVLTSDYYIERFGIDRMEFFALLFFASTGMVVLVTAYNLVSLFLGLELMSLPVYIMVAFRRRDLLANEAALKYFLLGAFSIAFLLYGISLIYGLCGSTNYKAIIVEVMDRGLTTSSLFLLAVALLLAGFAFKVSAVPFHMWVPDVYQGAPTPVTSFMATAVKAAAFAALLRLFYMCFMMVSAHWVVVVWVLAVVTMTLGNLVALAQRNIKRMMAYSGIAHAGYVLVGIASLSVVNSRAASAVMYYLLAYAFMNIGAFAFISAMEKRGGMRGLEIDDYKGLALRKPFLGLSMAVFMFSLAGIPPTAGFFAKYYVFSAAVERGFVGLAIIAVLNSLASLYYYLRVVVVMYMQSGEEPLSAHDDLGVRVVLLVSVLAILWLGIGPTGWLPGVENVLEWTRLSVAQLLGH